MGRGIAQCLLDRGFHPVVLDPNAAMPVSDRMTRAASAQDLANCELVIETITEDLAVKRALYDDLEQHLEPFTPIASNTSGFPITLLQSGRKQPNRFAGMHWASPPYATRFLEVIKGLQTDDETIGRIVSLAHELGKDPAIVRKDVPGFIANRLAYALYREAIHLVEQGVADVETIDRVCRHSLALWMPICGPFRWMDISGGPALYAKVMETILPTLSDESSVPETMQRLRQQDKRGSQSGEGFYSYGPNEDAEWQNKLHQQALKIWMDSK